MLKKSYELLNIELIQHLIAQEVDLSLYLEYETISKALDGIKGDNVFPISVYTCDILEEYQDLILINLGARYLKTFDNH